MSYEDALRLLEKAVDEKYNERLWQRWVAGPQHVMSFEDFKKEIEGPGEAEGKEQSVEDIMQKVESILEGTYAGIEDEDI